MVGTTACDFDFGVSKGATDGKPKATTRRRARLLPLHQWTVDFERGKDLSSSAGLG